MMRLCFAQRTPDTSGTSQAEDVTQRPEVPSADHRAVVDRERQRQAREHSRSQRLLSLVNLAVSAVVICALLFTRLGIGLRELVARAPAWQPVLGFWPVQVGLYFLVIIVASTLLALPIAFTAGYVLPRRYGLSRQTRRDWLMDRGKSFALSLPLELVAVEFVYALLALVPDTWWLWTGIAALFVSVILAQIAPVVFLPLFYKLTPLEEGEMRARALALAEQAHTRVRGIYTMNMSRKTTAANAMVMGLGPTRRIILGDTLLADFSLDEISVVLAHELGHQVHRDIPQMIAVESVTTLGGLFIVNLVLHAVVAGNGFYYGLADPATMPLLFLALGVFGLVLLPITNGFSRWIEYRADVYALESTRNPDAFESTFTRLANQNLAELEPSPLVEFFLYNHPATGKRIRLAQRYRASAASTVAG